MIDVHGCWRFFFAGCQVPHTAHPRCAVQLIPEGSGALEYGWHRSVDNDNWDVVEGAVGPEHVLTAEDAGSWLFAEWRYVDPSGARLAEGSSEATLDPIRLLSEDRDDLKDIVLKRSGEYNVSTREGPAKILVDVDEVTITYRVGGSKVISLSADTLSCQPDDAAVLLISPSGDEAPLSFTLESAQAKRTFLSKPPWLTSSPSALLPPLAALSTSYVFSLNARRPEI